MDQPIHSYFHAADWVVVFGYLILCTIVGHVMRGKQGSIRDFFLGGRSLPWPAVCGSIIATEISALTFIGVPGTVFAVKGDFTYLQWAIGSIIARFAVARWLVPLYYEKEIYSPYDFMGMRLGQLIKRVVTVLFALGAILGQSVRVLVTAIVLKVVTGMEIHNCVMVIGLFAIGWTWMGGMRTVIWTDVMQFFIFVFGAVFALGWLVVSVDGGWKGISDSSRSAKVVEFEWNGSNNLASPYGVIQEDGSILQQIAIESDPETGKPTLIGTLNSSDGVTSIQVEEKTVLATVHEKNKMKLWEFGFTDKDGNFLIYTLWIALLAMPFQNFGAFGTDQLMAQRLFCCRNEKDARKAIIWSSISQLITVLMLLVSAGLYVWYNQRHLTPQEFDLFNEDPNNIFPVWITTVLPVGISGLLVAGAFAAAISSLDSILAALSQTTLSAIYGEERFAKEQESSRMVWNSRAMVILWGVALTGVAILLNIPYQAGEKDMIGFAFRMVSYTYGPIIGILFLSILPVRVSVYGTLFGVAFSMALAAWAQPDLFNLLEAGGIEIPLKRLVIMPFPWFFPINAGITFLCGWGVGMLVKSK